MKLIPKARRRAGFTLVETLVTVGIIAVLAAFVVPTVIQKASAGDPVKVSNDLTTLRTALESFATDTKAGFPQLITSLAARPSTSDVLVDGTTALTSDQVSAWNGPYLAATLPSTATTAVLPTGYTANFANKLVRYDVTNDGGEDGSGTGTFSATNTLFAAVKITGLTEVQAQAVNKLVDGSDDPVTDGQANTTGRFRYSAPTAGAVTAYFMTVPITK